METRKEDVLRFLDSVRQTVSDDEARVVEAEVRFGTFTEVPLPLSSFPLLLPSKALTITIKINGGA